MPRYGKPALASWSPDRLDVFFKSKQGTLIHAWLEGSSEGSHDLGGSLDSDPVALTRGPGKLDVFARSTEQRPLHWKWLPNLGRLSEEPATLPGYLATNPVPTAMADLYLLATSLEGFLRFWRQTTDSFGNHTWSGPHMRREPGTGTRDPVVAAGLHLVIRNNSRQLDYLPLEPDGSGPRISLGGELSSGPVAMSWSPGRFDVYARNNNRVLKHWGRDDRFSSPLPSRWFENEPTPGIIDPLDADPLVVPRADDEADMFLRTTSGALRHWRWDGRNRLWVGGGSILEGLKSHPAAIWRSRTRLDLVTQSDDNKLLHWWQDLGRQGQREWTVKAVVPHPANEDISDEDARIHPQFLIARAADHALLGFSAPRHRVIESDPPRLVAEGADPGLALTFPPQHVAEEVSRKDEAPLTTADGIPVWKAELAGPSHVAFSAAPGTPIELTSEGVLAALDGAPIVASPERTGIELPYGLVTTPSEAETGEGAVARHPAAPLEKDGTIGLWRTRLGNAVRDGELMLGSPRAMRSNPFPMALTRPNRSHIALQQPPAHAARLELSALGGSLTASGKWGTFEWDHQAALGRDQYVRTVTKGVLYPFGHRAVFVELSERKSDEPIAVLRKKRSLYISEPTRQRPASGRLRHAFPFDEVEITTLEYSDIDPPEVRGWGKIGIPTSQIAELESQIGQWAQGMDDLWAAVHAEMGPGDPVMEDKALEMAEAREYMWRHCVLENIQRDIAVLEEGGLGEELVDVFFMPHLNGKPINFPVRAEAANRGVHFQLPLIFVADIRNGLGTHASFHSLVDPRVEERVSGAYRAASAGVVELAGIPINLSPSEDGTVADSDLHEVHRLNIIGHSSGESFAPSLGGINGEEWAAEIGLPTVRGLIGGDPHAEVRFDDTYLAAGAGDVALRLVGNGVGMSFSKSSDRSGGLIAPNSVATGVSRTKGLVNVDGLQPRGGGGTLDPAKLFTDRATLFGFPLKELVKDVREAPEVVTILRDGQPPTVRMTWKDIALKKPDIGGFEPLSEVSSRLTLEVESAPALNKSTCTLTNFKLVMPPTGTLIEVYFDSVTFTQQTGQAPNLSIKLRERDPVIMKGELRLLKTLQDRVGLGKLGPRIEADPTGITARYAVPVPDVAALSFVMSNLAFGATLRVPFNGDPVSLALGFASRERPFTLTVMMFGGGGYVDLELIHTGLRRLEISLQFGAAVAINFGIGQAEVHAFGGIRYALVTGRSTALTGFIHIGGSVEVLGLISVSVELRVNLDYQFDTNRLVGRAKLVIEIDITLFSDSVELDSGEWVISGGERERSLPPPGPTISRPVRARRAAVDAWRIYREAFA